MADEKKEPEKIKCPCCGELTLTQPLDVKGVTLDEFLSSIITGEPYTHTYKMYSGSVEVTVEALPKQTSNVLALCTKVLRSYITKLEASDDEHARAAAVPVNELLGTMRRYFGVKMISMYKDKKLFKQYLPADAMREAAAEISNAYLKGQDAFDDAVAKAIERCLAPETISALPVDAVENIVLTHADIYIILMNAGFDENFWEGIELA